MISSQSITIAAGDPLQRIAHQVIAQVRPNRGDRDDAGDCFQTAYLAGLQAHRSAERAGKITSNQMIRLAMRQAVYRALRRAKGAMREADLQLV